jgi:formylglycine-generating enzyme required for sulfatase activity
MLCLTWFEAFAFCAWDGGRLPTEAEWNYAAAGGDEQRPFPWGSDEPSATLAAFDCTADASEAGICSATDILSVGARSPMGDGRWGQFDLAGNAYEWVYDSFTSPYINPCDNCAESDSPSRVLRGGSFSDEASFILSSSRFGALPHNRTVNFGGRCARDL